MHIVWMGLVVLGVCIGVLAAWYAISSVGFLLADLFNRLPDRLQAALALVGAVGAVVAVVAVLGEFYRIGRLHHDVAFSVGMSIFFTTIFGGLLYMAGSIAGAIFGWTDFD